MSRPHICFVQAQAIPWSGPRSASGFAALGIQVEVKVLSRDHDTGAVTEIMRLPKGMKLSGPMYFPCVFEFYVLDGAFTVGNQIYKKDSYAYLPPGFAWSELSSESGAILLAMFSATPRPTPGSAPVGMCDPALVIAHLDVFAMEWKTGVEGSVTGKPLSSSIFTKKLRVDPVTAEQTFLYSALPHHAPPKVMPGKFAHPMIEEIFVLSGEYVFGDVGKMGAGGYCWWRENEYHGPAGSEIGYNLLIRVHGGPLVNMFSKEPAPFTTTPEHRPALPKELSNYSAPYPFQNPW